MYWVILIIGLSLWIFAHLFKRLAPQTREGLGDKGRGLVALAIFASIALMVIGYRGTPFVNIWQPPSFLVHANNLLMFVALFMMSPAAKRGKVIAWMRHPMLTGFALWAIAHLLVNGDLTAILTFGALLIWSILSARLINSAVPEWAAPTGGSYKFDAMFAAGTVILLAVVGWVHNWIGVWPFPS